MNTTFLSRSLRLALLTAASAFGQATTSSDSTTWLDYGLNYSRGDYGFTQDTEVTMGLLTATTETSTWRFQGLLPVLNIKGPASVAGGGQGIGGAARPTMNSETGLGDITLGAAYKFGAIFGGTTLDLGAQLKLPTGSEARGLGTGETDTFFQADLRHPMGNVVGFISLGYRFLGHSVAYPLKDGVYTSVGFVHLFSSASSAGVSYNWRQRFVAGGDHSSELLGFFLHQLNDRWRVQGYVLAGFTNASPDFGGGASIGYRF